MSERIDRLLDRAKTALSAARRLRTDDRRRGLEKMAEALKEQRAEILSANETDLGLAKDLGDALRDRLRLTPSRFDGLVRAVEEVARLPDPIGEERPIGLGKDGIEVFRRRVPLGVLAVVYEARPNVTAECAALAVASANAIVLRVGKEASHSNEAIGRAVRDGLQQADLPVDLVTVLSDSTRDEVRALLGAVGRVDLVIPRGGEGLMRMVDEHARVPVIRHGRGVCHVYVDAAADLDMAARIAENAKVQRPSVCNAVETLVVHRAALEGLAARLSPRLEQAGVELRADRAAEAAFRSYRGRVKPASEADWDEEFQALILAIRTVDTVDEAIEHIDRHGTYHTASVVTADPAVAERFFAEVDASCVLWNASTRYNDGGQLGLGAEMGISTTRMHAYGPMSVRELTAEKLIVRGAGQVRG